MYDPRTGTGGLIEDEGRGAKGDSEPQGETFSHQNLRGKGKVYRLQKKRGDEGVMKYHAGEGGTPDRKERWRKQ